MDVSSQLLKQGQGVCKPRLSRTSVPKVRTGCITCKKRHIKCDESRPSCKNCLKSQKFCEGYIDAKRPDHATSLLSTQRLVSYVVDPLIQLHLDPDLLDFADDGSMLYFQEFVQLMQDQWMTGTSNSDFWSTAMPQIVRGNNALRHAAMAIGSLCMWQNQQQIPAFRLSPVEVCHLRKPNDHWTNALTYYGKSLRLSATGSTTQDAVLLSVLLIHFEMIRGNRRTAIDHVNHGLSLFLILLMDTFADQNPTESPSTPRSNLLVKELANIFLNLEGQTRLILRDKLGDHEPLPNFSKTLQMRKQSIETFSYYVNIALIPKNANLEYIPPIFTSLDEFEACLDSIYCRQNTIVPIMLEIFRHSGMLQTNDNHEIVKLLHEIFEDPRIKEFCDESVDLMKRIDAGFMPLFQRITLQNDQSPEYLRAMQLRLRHLGIYIFENIPQYLNIDAMQALTPFCYEFLSIAGRILKTLREQIRGPAHYISMHSVLAFHLLSMSTMCRDPLVREQASHLLRDYPCQDGLWNIKSFYVIAVRNRFVEQLNATEDPPAIQWMRLWRREYVFEDGGERIVFRYLVKDEETKSWELIEEMCHLEEDIESIKWIRRPPTAEGRLFMGSVMPWG